MANLLVSNLSGGMNAKASPLILRDSECELILNYKLDTVGSLTKRNGFSVFADQATDNMTCNGLYQYTKTSAAAKTTQLMVNNATGGATSTIFYNNGGVWTNSKTGLTKDKKTRFVTFLDYVFYVNGADVMGSSTDPLTPTWGTTNCLTVIKPTYAAIFQDRLYVANGAVSNFSRLWFSSLPAGGAITWDSTNDWVDINPDDGDSITALENNGNRLLVFKNRALYRWTFGQVEPDRLLGVGTSSQESVKTNFDVGLTFFANQRGVYAYGGERPNLISRKIQKYVDAVSDWTNVFGEVDEDHYYLFVGNITVDGRTFTNTMFVYNVSLDAWTVYTLTEKITWMARLIETSPVEKIYFGNNDGDTFLWNSGTTDNTAEINGEILSKEYLLAMPNETLVKDVTVFSSQRVSSKVRYQFDRDGDWKPLTSLAKRFTRMFTRSVGKCQSIRLRITDSSKVISILDGWNLEHVPQKEKYGR